MAHGEPDHNTNWTVRVLLALAIYLAIVNTVAQFTNTVYKEPWWLVSILVPGLLSIIYDTYKSRHIQRIRQTLRVMLVESDPLVQNVVRSVLQRNDLCQSIINAETLEAAKEIIDREGKYKKMPVPDVIIVDTALSDGTSEDLFDYIRMSKEKKVREIPLVILTTAKENGGVLLARSSAWVEKTNLLAGGLAEALNGVYTTKAEKTTPLLKKISDFQRKPYKGEVVDAQIIDSQEPTE